MHLESLFFEDRPAVPEDRLDDFSRVHRFRSIDLPTRTNPCKGQDAADHLGQTTSFPLDELAVLLHPLGIGDDSVGEVLACRPHGRERRPELVRNRCNESPSAARARRLALRVDTTIRTAAIPSMTNIARLIAMFRRLAFATTSSSDPTGCRTASCQRPSSVRACSWEGVGVAADDLASFSRSRPGGRPSHSRITKGWAEMPETTEAQRASRLRPASRRRRSIGSSSKDRLPGLSTTRHREEREAPVDREVSFGQPRQDRAHDEIGIEVDDEVVSRGPPLGRLGVGCLPLFDSQD